MSSHNFPFSTGLSGLDEVLQGLVPGDNIVWQVDSIDEYQAFVEPFYKTVRLRNEKMIYFRFSRQNALVPDDVGAEIHRLSPHLGFEAFITKIHDVIEAHGKGGFYVFDSLSELALDCYSDRMVGNFFMLTCPYLLKLEAIAYFAVLRNYHSFHAASPIAETTQLLLDVYRHKGKMYVHPLKVHQRFSPTINMLHVWEGDRFLPITHSAEVAEVLTSVSGSVLETASYQLGVWNRMFLQAEEMLEAHRRGECSQQKIEERFDQLLRMAISRDECVLRLAKQYLSLAGIIEIRKRMNGTGFIGGKSVGMILARAILKKIDPRWNQLLEVHDSFYIGSDVFYTFLVLNDCWWMRKKQKDPKTFLDDTEETKRRILNGKFPDYIVKRFSDMLDYYGQSPIIVRSSSLFEDTFGNTFAGKYESVFCVNQGSHRERMEAFMNAVRRIYASSMSEEALTYRARRGILDIDEQMALLVQRVSGAQYGHLFYPQVAGVGISFNPYVWCESIDPRAGVVRMVFGLGTRAVERSSDDFARLVALNAPALRPETGMQEVRRFTQRKVDVLNLETNELTTNLFSGVIKNSPGLPADFFYALDEELSNLTRGSDHQEPIEPTLSFQSIFSQSKLIDDIREMLRILQQAYNHPVDVEFTVNFFGMESYKINLLQCRPFQYKGDSGIQEPPTSLNRDDILLESHGSVIGHSRVVNIDRIIYVVPAVYGQLPLNDRYSIARLIGRLTRLKENPSPKVTMLIGPGRWGTTTPSLGVPVSFAEISSVAVLCEIVTMRENLTPDVSLGTHFFSNLVELDILYLALFPGQEGHVFNPSSLEQAPNKLSELIPSAKNHANAVRMIDLGDWKNAGSLQLNANAYAQKVVCYYETIKAPRAVSTSFFPAGGCG
ncbi:MAG: pyruvate, phosphate dikinase [Candidatus Omnitrophota bacterium]|jgi:hypothetical protein|nr:MAG: pyruvate, phosphate dikinase [Candidatus Omnitrophota bacterium]